VADASLVLTFPEGTSPAVAGEAAQTLAGALAAVDLLRARLSDGLDVVVQLDRPSV
jgi:hypothetical protein